MLPTDIIGKPYFSQQDATYRYIQESGMIDRGWISNQRLLKAVAISKQ